MNAQELQTVNTWVEKQSRWSGHSSVIKNLQHCHKIKSDKTEDFNKCQILVLTNQSRSAIISFVP